MAPKKGTPRRIGRPLYKRHYELVAVRQIRLGRDTIIKPGTKINKSKFRLHHLRSLYQRRRVGIAGHAWTEQALKSQHGMPKIAPKKAAVAVQAVEPIKDAKPWAVPDQAVRFATKAEAEAFIEANPTTGTDPVVPIKDGLIWIVPETVQRFKTKKEATKWIDSQSINEGG